MYRVSEFLHTNRRSSYEWRFLSHTARGSAIPLEGAGFSSTDTATASELSAEGVIRSVWIIQELWPGYADFSFQRWSLRWRG